MSAKEAVLPAKEPVFYLYLQNQKNVRNVRALVVLGGGSVRTARPLDGLLAKKI